MARGGPSPTRPFEILPIRSHALPSRGQQHFGPRAGSPSAAVPATDPSPDPREAIPRNSIGRGTVVARVGVVPPRGYHRCTRPGVVTPFVNRLAGIVSATGLRKHGGHMTTLSLGQAARLTGRGKTILARAISGRLFAASKEDGDSNIAGAESARVYPFPAPVETVAELRTRLTMAEERLSELKAMLEDMRRDRDAWREQAQTRLLPAPAARMPWWPWRRTAG
jgi:hypothetical protein